MQVTTNYEPKVVNKITLVLDTSEECKNFMFILNRAAAGKWKTPLDEDGNIDKATKLANDLYSKIYNQ